jgi:hypothetical protein
MEEAQAIRQFESIGFGLSGAAVQQILNDE